MGAQSQDMVVDADTRRGAQRQAAEAVGWEVQSKSRCTALCDGRGGGERVKERGTTDMDTTDVEE